jgi:hypothetical protein
MILLVSPSTEKVSAAAGEAASRSRRATMATGAILRG